MIVVHALDACFGALPVVVSQGSQPSEGAAMTGISGAAYRSHGGIPGSAYMQVDPVANISW